MDRFEGTRRFFSPRIEHGDATGLKVTDVAGEMVVIDMLAVLCEITCRNVTTLKIISTRKYRNSLHPVAPSKKKGKKSPVHSHGRSLFIASEDVLLLVFRRSFLAMREAVDVSGQQVNLVVALQILLRRHLALATVTDRLLQLREA